MLTLFTALLMLGGLEDSAADHMHTAYQFLSSVQIVLAWRNFHRFLNTRFGSRGSDAQFWTNNIYNNSCSS